jgi:hypothetical protein
MQEPLFGNIAQQSCWCQLNYVENLYEALADWQESSYD